MLSDSQVETAGVTDAIARQNLKESPTVGKFKASPAGLVLFCDGSNTSNGKHRNQGANGRPYVPVVDLAMGALAGASLWF